MSRFGKSDEELQTIISARAALRSGGSRESVIAILDGKDADDAEA